MCNRYKNATVSNVNPSRRRKTRGCLIWSLSRKYTRIRRTRVLTMCFSLTIARDSAGAVSSDPLPPRTFCRVVVALQFTACAETVSINFVRTGKRHDIHTQCVIRTRVYNLRMHETRTCVAAPYFLTHDTRKFRYLIYFRKYACRLNGNRHFKMCTQNIPVPTCATSTRGY